MEMKKILVTGSSGYIGQHLCLYLNHPRFEGKYQVTGLDVINNGGVGCQEFIHDNILNERIHGEYDAVVHLAALVKVGESQRLMMDYYRTNVLGTINLLEKTNYNNFIFSSTCQADADHVYGKTKSVAEDIIADYCSFLSIPHITFRFGNVVGSFGYKPTNTDGLLYNLMKAKETGVFHLYGTDYNTKDGSPTRDYIHVEEICYAIEKAISNENKQFQFNDEYYYLGHGKQYTVLECVNAFKKVNKCDFKVIDVGRRAGDPEKTPAHVVSSYMPLNTSTIEQMMRI